MRFEAVSPRLCRDLQPAPVVAKPRRSGGFQRTQWFCGCPVSQRDLCGLQISSVSRRDEALHGRGSGVQRKTGSNVSTGA